MLRIIFTKTELVIDETRFSVVLQNNQLENLSSRQLSYTNKFTLPKTSRNLQLLQDVGLLGANTTIYNENIEASIYLGDVPIIKYGFANILDTTLDTISFTIYSSVKALRDRLSKLKLSDIDYSELAHKVSVADIELANNSSNSPYIYSNTTFRSEGIDTERLYLRHLLPFISEKWLLNKILEGYEVDGEVPNSDVYLAPVTGQDTEIYLPTDSVREVATATERIAGIAFGNVATPLDIATPFNFIDRDARDNTYDYDEDGFRGAPSFERPTLLQDNVLLSPNTLFIKAVDFAFNRDGRYGVELNDKIGVRVTAEDKVLLKDVDAGRVGGYRNWLLLTYKDAQESGQFFTDLSDAVQEGYFFFDNERKQAEVVVGEGRSRAELYFVLQFDTLINEIGAVSEVESFRDTTRFVISSNPEQGQNPTRIDIKGDDSKNKISIQISGKLHVRSGPLIDVPEVDFSKLVPDITQLDFLKEILWRYGILISVGNTPTQLRLEYIDKILRGDTKRLDWSDNYIQLENKTYAINFSQRNYFKTEDYEGYDGYADWFFEVNNKTADEKRDLIQSIYRFEKPLPDFLNGRSISRFRVGIYGEPTNGQLSASSRSPAIFRASTLSRKEVLLDSVKSVSIDLWETTQNLLAWCQLVPLYYDALRQVANLNESVRAQFNLRAETIFNLDFFKTIYIKQLGGNFYINKVLNFTPGEPVSVDLIKLPNKFEEVPIIKTLDEGEGTISVTGVGKECILDVKFDLPPERAGDIQLAESYTAITLNFRVTGGSGAGYGVYGVYAHSVSIHNVEINASTGVGSFQVNPLRAFDGNYKTIELIVFDSIGNCGKVKHTFLLRENEGRLLLERNYLIPPDKNLYHINDEIIFDVKFRNRDELIVARESLFPDAVKVFPDYVQTQVAFEYLLSENILRVKILPTIDEEFIPANTYSFNATVGVNLVSTGRISFDVYVLAKNLPSLGNVSLSWLNEDNQDINNRLWHIVSRIPESRLPSTHVLSAVGILGAKGGVPPYTFEITNIPSEVLAGSRLNLMDFTRTSESATTYSSYAQLEDTTYTNRADALYTASTNNLLQKSIAIYTKPNIDTRQSELKYIDVKLTDNSPEFFEVTERFAYQYRRAGPINFRRVLPPADTDCANAVFGTDIEVFQTFDLPGGDKGEFKLEPTDLTAQGLGNDKIVIPLTDDAHTDVTYELRYTFSGGKKPYKIDVGICALVLSDTKACPDISRESAIILIDNWVLEDREEDNLLTIPFNTIANLIPHTILPYWEQCIQINIVDSCPVKNRVSIDYPILVSHQRGTEISCPDITLTPTAGLDFANTIGVNREAILLTTSAFEARILCDTGVFTITQNQAGNRTTFRGRPFLVQRRIVIVANDVPSRYSDEFSSDLVTSLLEVDIGCNRKVIELRANKLFRGRGCITIPSLNIGNGNLCALLNPQPNIIGFKSNIGSEAVELNWAVSVNPVDNTYPFNVSVTGDGTLSNADGSVTNQTQLFGVSTGKIVLTENTLANEREIKLNLNYSELTNRLATFSLCLIQAGSTDEDAGNLEITAEPPRVPALGGKVKITLTPTPDTDTTYLTIQVNNPNIFSPNKLIYIPAENYNSSKKLSANVWELNFNNNASFTPITIRLRYRSDSVAERDFLLTQSGQERPTGSYQLEFVKFGDQEEPDVPVEDICKGVFPTIAITPSFKLAGATNNLTQSFDYVARCAKTLSGSFNFGSFGEFVTATIGDGVLDEATQVRRGQLTFTVKTNPLSRARSATYQLEATNDRGRVLARCTIEQSANIRSEIHVTPGRTSVLPNKNATATFTYTLTNAVQADVTIVSKPDWATQTKFADGQLVYSLSDNTGNQREGQVVISLSNQAGFDRAVVTIVQGLSSHEDYPSITFNADRYNLGQVANASVNGTLTLERVTIDGVTIVEESSWLTTNLTGTNTVQFLARHANPYNTIRDYPVKGEAVNTYGQAYDYTIVEQALNSSGTNVPRLLNKDNELTLPAEFSTTRAFFYTDDRDSAFVILTRAATISNGWQIKITGSDSWIRTSALIRASVTLPTGYTQGWRFDIGLDDFELDELEDYTGGPDAIGREGYITVSLVSGTRSIERNILIKQQHTFKGISADPANITLLATDTSFTIKYTVTDLEAPVTVSTFSSGAIYRSSVVNPVTSEATSGQTTYSGTITVNTNVNTGTSQREGTIFIRANDGAGLVYQVIPFFKIVQLGNESQKPEINFPNGNLVDVTFQGFEASVIFTLTAAQNSDVTFGDVPDWITAPKIINRVDPQPDVIQFTIARDETLTEDRGYRIPVTVTTSVDTYSTVIRVIQTAPVKPPPPRPRITITAGDSHVKADGTENYTNSYTLTNAVERDVRGFVDASTFLAPPTYPAWFEGTPTHVNGAITVNVLPNTTDTERNFPLGIWVANAGGDDYATFTVFQHTASQDPAPKCKVTPELTEFIFGQLSATTTIPVTVENTKGTGQVTALKDNRLPEHSDFITATIKSSEEDFDPALIDGRDFVTIRVTANTSGEDRSGVVRVSFVNRDFRQCSAVITIVQKGTLNRVPELVFENLQYDLSSYNVENEVKNAPYVLSNGTKNDIRLLTIPNGFLFDIQDDKIVFTITRLNTSQDIEEEEVIVQALNSGGSDVDTLTFRQKAQAPRCIVTPSKTEVNFEVAGGTQTVPITYEHTSGSSQVYVFEGSSWITTPELANPDDDIKIVVAANTGFDERRGIVRISRVNADDRLCQGDIRVIQKGRASNRPELLVEDIDFLANDALESSKDSKITFSRTTASAITVSTNSDKITASKQTLTNGDTVVRAVRKSNQAFDVTITISATNVDGTTNKIIDISAIKIPEPTLNINPSQVTFSASDAIDTNYYPVISITNASSENVAVSSTSTDIFTRKLVLNNGSIRAHIKRLKNTSFTALVNVRVAVNNYNVSKDITVSATAIPPPPTPDPDPTPEPDPPSPPEVDSPLDISFASTQGIGTVKNTFIAFRNAQFSDVDISTNSDNIAVSKVTISGNPHIRVERRSSSAFSATVNIIVSTDAGDDDTSFNVTAIAVSVEPPVTGIEVTGRPFSTFPQAGSTQTSDINVDDSNFNSIDSITSHSIVWYDNPSTVFIRKVITKPSFATAVFNTTNGAHSLALTLANNPTADVRYVSLRLNVTASGFTNYEDFNLIAQRADTHFFIFNVTRVLPAGVTISRPENNDLGILPSLTILNSFPKVGGNFQLDEQNHENDFSGDMTSTTNADWIALNKVTKVFTPGDVGDRNIIYQVSGTVATNSGSARTGDINISAPSPNGGTFEHIIRINQL